MKYCKLIEITKGIIYSIIGVLLFVNSVFGQSIKPNTGAVDPFQTIKHVDREYSKLFASEKTNQDLVLLKDFINAKDLELRDWNLASLKLRDSLNTFSSYKEYLDNVDSMLNSIKSAYCGVQKQNIIFVVEPIWQHNQI